MYKCVTGFLYKFENILIRRLEGKNNLTALLTREFSISAVEPSVRKLSRVFVGQVKWSIEKFEETAVNGWISKFLSLNRWWISQMLSNEIFQKFLGTYTRNIVRICVAYPLSVTIDHNTRLDDKTVLFSDANFIWLI